MTGLGRLQRVDLRHIWQSEVQDFTPWLAREGNLSLLADTLGLDLELEAVEQTVGPFRADILCKDTLSDRWVLIENQLERTDHTHLGQLVTYAAGLDAVTVVWIAARVTEEHRAALDWLNEITHTGVRFFALEVELWRIGNSPAAPKFNVVSQPNDWSRTATAARKAVAEGEISPLRQMQRSYWAGVQDLLAQGKGPIRPVSPQPQSWISHGIGRTGVMLNMAINTRDRWIRAEIYCTGRHAKSDFAQLVERRAEIETAFGESLDWQALPGKQDARVCLARSGVDPANEADWPNQQRWLVETASRLHAAFRPHIARLDRDKFPEEEA